MSEILPFDDALSVLEEYSKETFVSDLYVPSLERNFRLKEITAKQQKKIISSVVDSSASGYKAHFIPVFLEILKENCSESKDVLENLTLIDRQFLTISLKSAINEKVNIDFEDGVTESVSLLPVLQKMKSYKHPKETLKLIEKNSLLIEIGLKVPTLKLELEYFNQMPELKKEVSDTETMKKVLSEAYIYETSKYISSLKIDNKDLGFDVLNVGQKYLILEKLPATIVQIVLNQITEWKLQTDKVIEVTSSNGRTKTLETDGSLFVSN